MHTSIRRSALRPTRIALAVGTAFLSSQAAWADPAANQLPTGAQVGAGTVSISTSGTKMQIDQASDKAIINWQNFSIGSSGWVNFNQPSASSVALNRSMQPAEVFGRLSANGQIFVTSQAGVYFARSAQVDVGGLVASNLSIRDQDFLAGRYIFSNEGSSGSVVNDGQINITTVGGYAALAGTQVQNNGVIVAQAGTVALAAGDRITLDMVGDGLIKVSVDAAALNALALNAGTLQADGGRVVLTARSANALLDTVINNTGVIRARSLVERNGEIVLDGGGAGTVAQSGTIDASSGQPGTTGGSVNVSGQSVVLNEGSTIDASGDAGGGTVTVKATDAALVYGAISARDTGGNGKGGTVETSGHYVAVTRAPDIGPGGTWLIDPYDIEVVEVVPPPGGGDTSQIAASLITGQLNAGANVVLDTGGFGSPGAAPGDIRVLAGIDKTAANPASLTLKAFHDVLIGQPIRMPGGFLPLTIEAGNDVVVNAPIATPDGGLRITAGGVTNNSAIENGVGPFLRAGMSITADRFNLAGGTINGGQGSVGLFTRTNTNSVGVESFGDTTITNADLASITTAPDSPLTNANQLLIGTGGSMRIGDNAQVNGGSKNLVLTAGGGTQVTVGANGVTSTGDVAITGGSIAATGTISGNHVVLRGSAGIGTPMARVSTAANTLAVNTGGNAYVSEANDVTLDNVVVTGAPVSNSVGGTLDFAANGSVTVGGIVFAGSGMNVDVAQDLNVVASPGRAAMLSTNGNQTVAATNISLQAALSGNNGRAFITNTGGTGDQMITVSGGSLVVAGGAGGLANQAGILSNGNQTINGNPQITITGGASGTGSVATQTHNSASIQTNGPGKTQTINAASITATAGGGNDAFAGLIGANQTIVVSGDVQLTGGAGTGAPIARIGGVSGAAPGATNLFLSARDVIVTGGDSATGEAGLGSTPIGTGPQPNTISVAAMRDVILDARNGGARIGTSFNFASPATGDISVSAGRDIQLKGGAASAAIRTGGNVNLNAGGSISENQSNAIVAANALATISGGSTSLIGDNRVASYSGSTSGGDLTLNNTGVLTVTNLSAANAALINAGNVTLGGPWNTSGASSISIASDLTVNNNVQSGGSMTLDVNGAVRVVGSGLQDASLVSFGGQTINARSMEVTSLDGRFVSVRNTGPSAQTINLSNGAGLDVQTLSGGGFAQVSADGGGNQTIRVADGDHVNVTGWRGNAWIVNPGGIQTLSLTGSGANAITIGSAGALGFSQIRGGNQSISAGGIGESGSIGITGADANGTFTGIASDQRVGGTQTVSTSGTLRITGGNAPNQPPAGFATGLFHNGSGEQRVSAANIEMQGGASGVNNSVIIIASPLAGTTVPGNQIIEASGGMALRAGSGTSNGAGIFQNRTGLQSVTAANLLLQGGSAGSNSGAFINAGFGGNQEFNVAGGTISITGGSGGVGNRAGFAGSANQTINGVPDIVLTGGSGGGVAGNGNNAFINTTGGVGTQQTINAGSITLRSGSGGTDNSAAMSARKQVITTQGDVNLIGGASAGTLGGVRLGGLGGATLSDTDLTLTLNNGGNLTLTGGSVPGNLASIGSGVGTGPLTNTINIYAGGSVVLNPGSTSARIGNSASAPESGGDISINAASIQLNGTGSTPTLIRTAGTVSLSTSGPGGISEGSNGFVQATNLSASSFNGSTSMSGPNRVGTLNAFVMGGDLTFNNVGDLNLQQVFVTGNLNAAGTLTMNVAGALKLDADATHDASAFSNGQTINAQSLSVTSRDGRFATLNSSGDQSISVAGGSVDVRVLSGNGFAQVSSSGNQSIGVVDGDHIIVDGGASAFAGGNQTLSITGTGRNAIQVGNTAAPRGSAVVAGRNQTVTAGSGDETGSITITGPGTNNTGISGFVTLSGVGADTQTISTSGTLRVTGGTAPSQVPNLNSGIFHNRQGEQTITAADIVLQGGPSGSNNSAFISTNGPAPNGAGPGGGDQVINASRSIQVLGSETGTTNRALITSNRNQTINGNADIVIHAGASQVNTTTNAAIVVNTPGMLQTIHAHNIDLSNAASGGIESFAGIIGSNQLINATGNVTLTGGASGGTLAGVRIGSAGGAVLLPTNLTMHIDGDLVLTGGAANNGVALGSSALSSQANNITINAGGSVVLNEGSGAGARIGGALADPGGGNIAIAAGGNIELNGATQRTAIRTNDNVTLNAGGSISEGSNGFVVARELTTTSGGAQNLVGPNQVSRFTAASDSGDVSLRNTAPVLTLGTMDLPGSLAIDQAGALAVPGTVSARDQSIHATGDVLVGAADGGLAGLFAADTIAITTPQSIVLRGSDTTLGGASIVAAGGLAAFDAGEVHLQGGAAPLAGATVMGGMVTTTVARDYTLTSGSGWGANALLFSATDISMTIGGSLLINGGQTPSNWARIQTATRDGTITLTFPNEQSGGFFVDGFEGKIKHGQDGFFTGVNKPAKLGDSLLLIYGL